MSKLTELMDYLEENIDLEHIELSKKRTKDVISFRESNKCAVTIGVGGHPDFSPVPIKDACDNMELMMYNELLQACEGTLIKDDRQPSIRTNYGVGTLASLFSVESFFMDDNTMPWVNHVSKDEILKILDKGIPDVRCGLGQRVLETYEFYAGMLAEYPNIQKGVHMYHPDIQGPLDVTHLIYGNEMYYDMYDEPDLVKNLISLVSDTYIKFMKEIKKYINDEEDGFCWHWGTLFPGDILLRDDTAVNLSPDMYEEFVKGFDEKVIGEFKNGASIHYCGQWQSWVDNLLSTEGLRGVNFGPVPGIVYGREFFEKIYSRAKPKKIAVVNYFVNAAELVEMAEHEYFTGVYYQTATGGLDEAKELLNKLR